VGKLVLVEFPEELPRLLTDRVVPEVAVTEIKYRFNVPLEQLFFDDISSGAIFLGL